MTGHGQEVQKNYIGNPRVIEGKNGQVWWSGEQACDDGKGASCSKKGL